MIIHNYNYIIILIYKLINKNDIIFVDDSIAVYNINISSII